MFKKGVERRPGLPKSICRHPDPGQPEVERSATLASIILDLSAGEMHVAAGEPCEREYQSYAIA